jgi:ubiquinone/menaquinone biosynthesis C-methylase UbiE
MKNTFKKIQNKYLSPYANRNFEVLDEWENLVESAKEYGDSGYAIQQARIPSSFLAKRLLQLGFYKGELALDLGCGYGQWTIALGVLNQKAIGVDLHSNRLEIAKELANQALKQPKVVKFIQGQAERLDTIENSSVDFVYCYGVFMFLNQQKALAEIQRVLKPGGRLYICTNSYGWWLYLAIRHGITNRHILFSSLKALTLGSRGLPSSLSRRSLARVLRTAGFEEIKVDLEGRINSVESMNTYKSRFLFLPMCIESIAVKPKTSNGLVMDYKFIQDLFEKVDQRWPLELGMRDSIAVEGNLSSQDLVERIMILKNYTNPLQQISNAHKFIAESIVHDLQFQPLTSSREIPHNLSINLALKSGRCGSKARALADLLVLLGWNSGIIVTGHHVNTWIRFKNDYVVLDCDIYAPGQITYPDSLELISLKEFIDQDKRLNLIANSYHYLLELNRKSGFSSGEALGHLIAVPSSLLNSRSGKLIIYERVGSKDVFKEFIKVPKRPITFLNGLPSLRNIDNEFHISSGFQVGVGLYGSFNEPNSPERITDLVYLGDFANNMVTRQIIPEGIAAIAAIPKDYLTLNPGMLTSLLVIK